MGGLAESLEDSAGVTDSFPMRKSVLCPNRALLCSDGAEFLDSVDISSREKDGARSGDEMDIDSTVNVGDEIVIQWATDGPLSNEFYECVVMGRRKGASKDTFVVMHCDRWAEETVNLLPSSRGSSWMFSADAHDLPIYLVHCSSTSPMQKRCILRLHPSAPMEPALVRGAIAHEPSTWDELAGVPFTEDERVPALVKARETVVARIAEQRLPGAYDLAAHVPLGEIYQAACPLVIPEKEDAIDKGSVDVGVVDLERIKALGAFADKNEKLKGLKRPSTPMAINGQGKRAGGAENVIADLKRKREMFVGMCSEKMPLGWSKMESVGAETIAKRARIDRAVEEAQTSLDAAREEAEGAGAIEKAADESVISFKVEQTSLSTENEKNLLSKLERLHSAINDESRESLWYHEKFFACGDLHPSTPNGAAHALICMKKTEVRRSCFALAAIRLIATSATSSSGDYPRAIRVPGALSPEGGKRSMDLLLKIAASKNKDSPGKDFPSKEANPNQPLVAIMPEQVGSDEHIGGFNWARRQTLIRIKEDTALQSRVSTLPVTTYPPVVLHPLAELIVGFKFGDGMLELARAVCGSMELVLDDKAYGSICVLDSAKPGDFEAACIEGCLYSALAYNSVHTLAMVVVGDAVPNPLFEAAVAGSGGMLTLTHIRPGANGEAERYQEIRTGKPNVIMVIADARLPGGGPSRQGGGVGKAALEDVVRKLSVAAKELEGRLIVSVDGGARGCLYVPSIAEAMLGTDSPQQEVGGQQQAQQWERNAWSMMPLEDLGFTYSSSCRFAPVLGSMSATISSAISYVSPKAAGASDDAVQEGNIVQLLSRGLPFRLMACRASSDSATFGVLAQEPIPKGSVVCEFVGEVARQCGGQGGDEPAEGGVKSSEMPAGEKRPTYELTSKAYGKSTRWTIDATRFGNVSRLISRGDEGDANLAPMEFADPRALPSPDSHPPPNRVALVAIRDIDQDEELVWA